MKSRNLFIGIILLFVGVVTLLTTLDVITVSWRIIWRLWPMLLIFIGIAILPLKDWLKAVLMLVALALGVLLYHQEAKKESEVVLRAGSIRHGSGGMSSTTTFSTSFDEKPQ